MAAISRCPSELWHSRLCAEASGIITPQMVRILFKRARPELFSPKKHGILGLTLVYSETTALSKPFILKLQSVRKFLRKRMLFKKQKVDSTGYYGIEDPLPDFNSKLRLFSG